MSWLPQQDSPVSGPFSGPPSSDSKYYSLVVYMVLKPKAWSGRLRQQIFVHVGCRQVIAHPGVAKVVAIAPILPRYRHVKYCGAFKGIKKDISRNTSKTNKFALILIFQNHVSESLKEIKFSFPELFSEPKWSTFSRFSQHLLQM